MPEHVVCNLCGADAPVSFLERTDRFTGKQFAYTICSRCGLIYLNPRPTPAELAGFYPANYEAYYTIDEKMSPVERWRKQRGLDVQLDWVEKFARPRGRLLDIGCGTGSFLKRAQERGWDGLGVEWVDEAARIARKHYGLDVRTGAVEDGALPAGAREVVTMWDVLEHVPDPARTLRECQRLLAPNGALIFSVPNLASISRYLFGRAWIGWDAPRHFHLFTARVIKQLLEQAGLKLIDQRCILGEEGVFALSLESIPLARRFTRSIGWATVLLWPYKQVAYALNRGGVITFAARKSGA